LVFHFFCFCAKKVKCPLGFSLFLFGWKMPSIEGFEAWPERPKLLSASSVPVVGSSRPTLPLPGPTPQLPAGSCFWSNSGHVQLLAGHFT
jgi:hypothetical protein